MLALVLATPVVLFAALLVMLALERRMEGLTATAPGDPAVAGDVVPAHVPDVLTIVEQRDPRPGARPIPLDPHTVGLGHRPE